MSYHDEAHCTKQGSKKISLGGLDELEVPFLTMCAADAAKPLSTLVIRLAKRLAAGLRV